MRLSNIVSRIKWSFILVVSLLVAFVFMLPLVILRCMYEAFFEAGRRTVRLMIKLVAMMIEDCRNGINEGRDNDDDRD